MANHAVIGTPAKSKGIVYWFKVPKSVQDFIRPTGKQVVTEIGFMECSNEDEKLALEISKGVQQTFVTEMVHRCLYGYSVAPLDKDGNPDLSARKIFHRGSDKPDDLPDHCYESWHSKVQSICHSCYAHIHGLSQKESSEVFLSMSLATS